MAFSKWNGNYTAFSLSPSSKTIVFTGAGKGGNDLYLLDLATLKVRALTHSPEIEDSPQFSPDGKQIAYAAMDNGTSSIFVISLDGKDRQQLTHEKNVADSMPSFSSDGSQIIFMRAARHRPYAFGGMTWGGFDVYVINKDGSHLRRLTNKQYHQLASPQMAPQSQTVIYQAEHGTGEAPAMDILQIDAAYAGEPVLLTRSGFAYGPVFSSSGSQIYFCSVVNINSGSDYDYEVWVMDSDGSHPRQITHAHSLIRNIAVAPDGQHVYVLSYVTRRGRSTLAEVTLSDGRMRQIADSSLFSDPMHWKPDVAK